MILSDCCGVELVGSMVDMGICPRCHEHCEAVNDCDNAAEYDDYIPGFDDGEGWDPIMGDDDEWTETDDEWLDDFHGEAEFA